MTGYGVKVYFKPTNTLRQILVQLKDKVIKERVVCLVYHISCDSCEVSYIGEIGRSLKSRFMSSVNSEVSRHVNCDQPHYSISLDNVRILEVELKWFERGVREAIQVRINNPILNSKGTRMEGGTRSQDLQSCVVGSQCHHHRYQQVDI